MRRTLVFALALALPLSMAACGDDGTGPDDTGLADGTFTASVSGDLAGEFQGQALFGEATDPETGEDVWILVLTSGSENSGKTLYFGRLGTRPGTGNTTLADIESDDPDAGEVFALYFDYTSQTVAGVFGSTGGTLNITGSSGDEMSGTFTIQAVGTALQGSEPIEANVSITGEFKADNGSVGLPGVF